MRIDKATSPLIVGMSMYLTLSDAKELANALFDLEEPWCKVVCRRIADLLAEAKAEQLDHREVFK